VISASTLALAAAGPAAAATDIKVGVTAINSVGTIPWGVSSGVFKRNGLNVTEVKIFPAPPPTLAALAAGAVQFAYAPSIPILNAYANGGVNLKVVAVADGYPAGALTAAKKDPAKAALLDDTGTCVSPTSGINSWKDLEGKTVSVPARKAQGEVTIAQAVKAAGGNPASVNFVVVPFGAALDSVKQGKIQAAFTVEPFTSECAASGLKNLGSPGVQFFTNESAIGMWVTTGTFADQNPTAVAAFQKSIRELNTFASTKAGWEKILQSMNPTYTQVDLATARKANPAYYPATIVKNDLANPASKMLALGFLTKPVDVNGLLLKQYR
jgi:NitT/TauT family transport system substrate-binding protein